MVLARMLWSTHEGMYPLMMTAMRISFLTTMRDHVSPSYSYLDCAYYRLLFVSSTQFTKIWSIRR